jgi:hypothetical protein
MVCDLGEKKHDVGESVESVREQRFVVADPPDLRSRAGPLIGGNFESDWALARVRGPATTSSRTDSVHPASLIALRVHRY